MHNILNKYFNFIRRYIPDKSQENAVGIDIGSSECKAVELTKEGDSYKLLNWFIETISDGNVAAAIKNILEKLNAPCKSPYTSIFGKGTLIRYIDMPAMSIDDLKQSFGLEADKYFPFSQDQIYTDCYILDKKGNGKQMSVMAAAAKKELIDARMKLLTELELQVGFIGIDPICLANVVNVLGFDGSQEERLAVALLDMGETVSSLTIIVDKLPRFTRDIFIGGSDFTNSISNSLGVSAQEAENLKNKPGDKKSAILEACESTLLNIVQELRLSFDYFTTEKNCEITQLLITGGGSLLEGIFEPLEKNLEIQTKRWNPLEFIQVPSDDKSEELTLNSCKLGVALGLALYHYD